MACSDVAGTFQLNDDELVFDNSTMPFIFSASNGMMLEIGGAVESDESLRNRLQNQGPLANVLGTVDNAVSALYAVDGVTFVRFANVETCIGNGPMFIVYGGRDSDICETLLKRSGATCSMVGESACGSCNDIRFQRPCPVLLCIEVTVNDDCPLLTDDAIRSIIMSVAPNIAKQTKLRANDIAKLQGDIDSVRFAIKKPELHGCPEQSTQVYNDPLSNTPLRFATSNPFGLCGGQVDCGTPPTFVNSVTLNPWQYFIMDASQITFVRAPKPTSDCVVCP